MLFDVDREFGRCTVWIISWVLRGELISKGVSLGLDFGLF